MEVSDLQVGQISVVELKPADGESFGISLSGRPEVILLRAEATGEVLLRIGTQVWAVVGADPRNSEALKRLVERRSGRLCWLAGAFPKHGNATTLVVQAHEFAFRHLLPDAEPIKIGVDDKIVEDIHVQWFRGRRKPSPNQVLQWLTENTLLDSARVQRVLYSADPALAAAARTGFRLHGPRIAVDVKTVPEAGYRVTRVVSSNARNEQQRQVSLSEGQFSYYDATAATEYRETGQTQWDDIVRQAGSYLGLWKEYNRLEREGVLRRARDLGWLRYNSRPEQLPDGQWRFRASLDESTLAVFDALQDQGEVYLEVGEDVPPDLAAEPMSDGEQRADEISDEHAVPVFVGQCTAVNLAHSTLDLLPLDPEGDDEPLPKGVIYLALKGDRVRLRRREQARQSIASAGNPMPWLRLLLEGQPTNASRRSHRIRVKESDASDLFGGKPTARQMQALEVALNTPDIALIQGPPGTGKTRVIAALEKILADSNESREVSGRTLLTSYQHDAVEHAASRTLVLGLPAIKIGHRRGSAESDDTVENWRRQRAEGISDKLSVYPRQPVEELLRQVRRQTAGYVLRPGTSADTAELLHHVFESTLGLLPPELSDRLAELELQSYPPLAGERKEDRDLVLRAVRALRTDPVAFSDDGPHTAYKLLTRLRGTGLLTENELGHLEQAADWEAGEPLGFLPQLQAIRERLLNVLVADPMQERSHLVNLDIETALIDVIEALHQHVRQRRQPVEATLYGYLDDLNNDPHGVRATLQDYTAVLAATCQQSVSRPMEKAKGEGGIRFDTVIVDEAARANPLDLMIPMARAERRIILVGDHRQLPHILEPDVERQLESSQESTRDELALSLFERLFNHARELERRDGIKRAITLDAQYRMHPELGAFVSRAFYEPYGEGFASPRPAGEFEHRLERYEGKPAAWVDLPLHLGGEGKGRSKRRPVEAQWVAREAKRILDQAPELSVGVITFYVAQVKEILSAMRRHALAIETDSGFQLGGAYAETKTPDGQTRLRVGTVDAFQGREFDVVLLSMTRSNRIAAGDLASNRKKYGFLTLEKRLCVAMSRQKRLLVVVGDGGMVLEEGAEKAIPGLRAFYELCGGDHGLRLQP